MIAEALQWLCTPCPWPARRHGYLYEAIALQARSRRCADAWAPHLAASRRFLAAAAAGHGGRALVLGSGLLLDVPLAELCAVFDEVLLVDLVHPWPVRRQLRRFPRARLLTADLSGTLAGLARGRLELTPALTAADWVASVNLWSQLPLLPRRLALRQGLPATAVAAWSQRLLARHLAWLRELAPHGALLADRHQETRTANGELVASWDGGDLLTTCGAPAASWEWRIAPSGELADGMTSIHQVGAWRW